ncbi:MAG: sugar ABC transporter permease [Chloroflexota bacterium]|nr:sugar ABC transporter permease [Chloroflexota bacterium]
MATEQTSVPMSRARSRGAVRMRETQMTLVSLLYLLPSLVAFTVFVFYPVVKSVWISLHADNPFGGTSSVYVGLDQYKNALSSPDYRNSLKITLLYTLYTVPVGLAVALLLAVMANLRLRAISIFRVAFAITIGVSVAAGAVIFALLYNPSTGVLNYFLTRVGLPPIQWLTHTNTALWAIAIGTIWLGLGFNFTILLSGLQGIPEELYESARIDGAGAARMFFNVTLPLLSPTLFFVSVISVIAAFQSFAQIDVLTKGGPAGSTNVVVYSIYRDAFFNFHSAYASAQAVILFIILLILTGIQFKSLEGRVFYQ